MTDTANRANTTSTVPVPFLRLAFRPLFWLGALFSVVAVALWSLHIALGMPLTPYGGSYFWHTHEMLFGFVAAIMAGFLLTAVQNWTGVRSLNGKPLAALVLIWLLGRVVMLAPVAMPQALAIAIDLLFLPLAALWLTRPIIKTKQWHNIQFVPILLLMAVLNGLSHLSLLQPASSNLLNSGFVGIAHSMILLVALVMVIMGGRVFPMFTANGTGTPRVAPLPWLERLAIASILASVVVSLLPADTWAALQGTLFLLAGLSNIARALRWRPQVTLRVPLVWSLHLSYLAMCLGLILLGLVAFGILQQASIAYHAITVGGMGLMILSMISRVSLGHSGRPIVANRAVTLSLLLMAAAFITRVTGPLLATHYEWVILLTGALWVAAYGLFTITYSRLLFSARADGVTHS
ncbi:NnrS family protein [Pseudomaricurvus sp. HS19]|uniref:NnrS family protein n=1 Tax=Pseudomaricurvus sp. HS19 TaxID=2692626 RepID=UPI0013711A5C|nr:NnrS family protein [Pseudomaricurvus sp. HS19]MYM64481.1 NnrS family protein [Pseudomaricurvus sp. HS19]